MTEEDDEIEKAVEAVDKMEDDAAKKRENNEKDEDMLIICPKCMRPVTEGDYVDQFTNPMQDSMITKIECPQCGFMGMPIEMDNKEYQKMLKSSKK